MRTWEGPRYTRLVFELSAPVTPHLFALSNPRRLVVDLPVAALMPGALQGGSGPIVRDIRSGRLPTGGTRFVVDLRRPVRRHVFLLKPYPPYGYRLVVDLREAGSTVVAMPAKPGRQPVAGRKLVIAIDPGHGGDDPGAVGVDHIEEKNVVLAIARDLVQRLNETSGISAFLTRTGDYYVPLRRRFEIATAHRADAFVSIHADSLPGARGRSVRGSSIYILSRRGASREAGYLARSENASDLIGGASLDLGRNNALLNSVLVDMSQTGTISASHRLAHDILGQLRRIGTVHTSHVDRAAFMVLSSPAIPSVLIETAFISNPYEARKLNDPAFQKVLARRICAGIVRDAPALRARSAPSPLGPGHTVRYVVKHGETLRAIARRYHVDVRTLRQANGLRGDRVGAGRQLVIPDTQTAS